MHDLLALRVIQLNHITLLPALPHLQPVPGAENVVQPLAWLWGMRHSEPCSFNLAINQAIWTHIPVRRVGGVRGTDCIRCSCSLTGVAGKGGSQEGRGLQT